MRGQRDGAQQRLAAAVKHLHVARAAVGHVDALVLRVQAQGDGAFGGGHAAHRRAGVGVEHQQPVARARLVAGLQLLAALGQLGQALVDDQQLVAGAVVFQVQRLVAAAVVALDDLQAARVHGEDFAQQVGHEQARAGGVQRRAGGQRAKAGHHLVHREGARVQHVQRAVLHAQAGQVDALVGGVQHQLPKAVRIDLFALFVLHLGGQLHGAHHLVGGGVDDQHGRVDRAAHVQAVGAVVQHGAKAFGEQRDLGLYGQGGRVQAQHLGRIRTVAKPAGGHGKHRVLARAVGQLVKALGQRLALHLSGLGRSGGSVGGVVGSVAGCGGRLRAACQRGGQGEGQQGGGEVKLQVDSLVGRRGPRCRQAP